MTTLKNTSGSKAVNIYKNQTGTFSAYYVQIYKGEEQVLQVKDFANVKNAQKWANKILN